MHEPKLGLISYMVSAFDLEGERDLVFVPVGINYDRVLEDRSLVRSGSIGKRSRRRVAAVTLGFVARNVCLMLRRRWYRLGYACVNFAAPISMRAYAASRNVDFRALEPSARHAALERLGADLKDAIAATIPVLPVSVVATVFVRRQSAAMSELEIKAHAWSLMEALVERGAYVHIPRADHDYAITVGLRMLVLRRFVEGKRRALPRARAGARHAVLLRQLDRAFFRRVTGTGVAESLPPLVPNRESHDRRTVSPVHRSQNPRLHEETD